MKATVKHLFVKYVHGESLVSVNKIAVSVVEGIIGSVPSLPYRQVLLLPATTLQEFELQPGDLRENIIVDDLDIHSLISGTVIKIGEVETRLTFHCEPCSVIKDKVSTRKIIHKRGYLGVFLNDGIISLGDSIEIVKDKSYESIPYSLGDRVKWYLEKQDSPVFVSKLVKEIGLSNAYCRAIPNIIRKRPDIDSNMIRYMKRKNKHHTA